MKKMLYSVIAICSLIQLQAQDPLRCKHEKDSVQNVLQKNVEQNRVTRIISHDSDKKCYQSNETTKYQLVALSALQKLQQVADESLLDIKNKIHRIGTTLFRQEEPLLLNLSSDDLFHDSHVTSKPCKERIDIHQSAGVMGGSWGGYGGSNDDDEPTVTVIYGGGSSSHNEYHNATPKTVEPKNDTRVSYRFDNRENREVLTESDRSEQALMEARLQAYNQRKQDARNEPIDTVNKRTKDFGGGFNRASVSVQDMKQYQKKCKTPKTVEEQPVVTTVQPSSEQNYIQSNPPVEKTVPGTIVGVQSRDPEAAVISLSIAMHAARAQGQRRSRVLDCEETQAKITACFQGLDDYDSSDFYDADCEEFVDNNSNLPDNAVASVPIVLIASLGGVGGSLAEAVAAPVILGTVLWNGGRFACDFIKKSWYGRLFETPAVQAERAELERKERDLERNINIINYDGYYIGIQKLIENSVLITMVDGYYNDPYAQVVTIVGDKGQQEIFVIPGNAQHEVKYINQERELDCAYRVPDQLVQAALKRETPKQQASREKIEAAERAVDQKLNDAEKKSVSTEVSLKKKNISSHEELLPFDGPGQTFKPAYSQNGKILRDTNGAYLDNQARPWKYNEKEGVFEVGSNGNHFTVRPAQLEMQPSPVVVPNNTGCGQIDPELNKPKILTTPIPDIEKPELSGCGRKDPGLDTQTSLPGGNINDLPKARTDTAHGPISQPKAEDFVLKAESEMDRSEGDLRDVDVIFREDNKHHIFDDRLGYIIDTPENRQLILDLVKNFANFQTKGEFDKLWFGEILPDNRQLWAEVRNNIITNCGINEEPRECDSRRGYSNPNKPSQK